MRPIRVNLQRPNSRGTGAALLVRVFLNFRSFSILSGPYGSVVRILSVITLVAGFVGVGSMIFGVGLLTVTGNESVQAVNPPAKLTIDYPNPGSIFPPEITSPTFLWHEETDAATHWIVRSEEHTSELQ